MKSFIEVFLGRKRNDAAGKSSARLFACVSAAFIGAGCGGLGIGITGSGNLVSKNYELTSFTRVVVGNAFQVQITQASQHSVAVTMDDNLVDYVNVTQSGETLRIRLQPHVNVRKATLKATITLPTLSGVDLSGAVRATVVDFSSDEPFRAEVSGASHLSGSIRNGDARIEVSGASRVELQGSAASLNIDASGASKLNLEEYPSVDADVEVSGASHATVSASGVLEANASGASSVRYVGQPKDVKARTSGASSVKRK